MKSFLIKTIVLYLFVSSSLVGIAKSDARKLNSQAAKEYLIPIRPGYEGRQPFWNEFAKKFTYAPAFDFSEVKGAKEYRFTVIQDKKNAYVWMTPKQQTTNDEEDVPTVETLGANPSVLAVDNKDIISWSFKDASPKCPLSKIWNDIPAGYSKLVVEALDSDGKVIKTVGERTFLRDFPFHGPYNSATRSYKEAAIKAALYIHNMPAVQSWKQSIVPDMSYKHNTYPCKIIGATIRLEVMIAKEVPSKKDEAVMIAKNAAQFLIDQSRPKMSPLAFFPPTYYGGLVASAKKENQSKTLLMEASGAAMAFLDLYDLTNEKIYYDRAIGIADTYLTLQNQDGSFPMKVDFETGEPVNNSNALLSPLLKFLYRLRNQYGITKYEQMLNKGENWMNNVAVEHFDMTGQFEDVTVIGWKPYQNLTNCTAAPYASYLLNKKVPTPNNYRDAIDLIRFSEDQFLHWDALFNEDGFRPICTPCVYEQYQYRVPVDNSLCNVANAFLDLYMKTGDQLAYAKAKALIDNLTVIQNPVNGQILTTWDYRVRSKDDIRAFWINCSVASIEILLRFDQLSSK